jgi:hypothetical protein
MKIKINKFMEIGASIVVGQISALELRNIAVKHSFLDANYDTLFSSLPSFGVGVFGTVLGVFACQKLIDKLKAKETEKSIVQFESNIPPLETNVVKLKNYRFIYEPTPLFDVFKDDSYENNNSKIIPVNFKKAKIR